jgi:hypothetical protein
MKTQVQEESNETAEFLIFLTNEFALIYLIVQISLTF